MALTTEKRLLLTLLAAVATLAVSCSQPLFPSLSGNATAEQLAKMLENEDFVLVNTYIRYIGNIPFTDLSIPFDEIEDHLDDLQGTDSKIVPYCRSGGMSIAAAKTLAAHGDTDIYTLRGGMRAWERAGYEVISEE